MPIIVENAKSGVSICRLCDEHMKEGEERLGAALNKRITAYAHADCFLKTFAADKTPNNRGKCKLGCQTALKKDETRVGFQFDPADTIWFHPKCCATFLHPASKYTVTTIAGLGELDADAQGDVAKYFGSAKAGPSLPEKVKAKPEPVTGSEPKESKKRKTRISSKPIVKPKDDIGADEDEEDEGDEEEPLSKKSEKKDDKAGKKQDEEGEEGDEEDEGDDEGYGEDAPDRETDFECMTSAELRDECKKHNIKFWSKSKIKMIKELQEDIAKTMPTKEKTSEKDWAPPKDGEDTKDDKADTKADTADAKADTKAAADVELDDAKPAKKKQKMAKSKPEKKKGK